MKMIRHSLKHILLDYNIDYLFNLSLFYTVWAQRGGWVAVWLAVVRTATPLVSACVCVCLLDLLEVLRECDWGQRGEESVDFYKANWANIVGVETEASVPSSNIWRGRLRNPECGV